MRSPADRTASDNACVQPEHAHNEWPNNTSNGHRASDSRCFPLKCIALHYSNFFRLRVDTSQPRFFSSVNSFVVCLSAMFDVRVFGIRIFHVDLTFLRIWLSHGNSATRLWKLAKKKILFDGNSCCACFCFDFFVVFFMCDCSKGVIKIRTWLLVVVQRWTAVTAAYLLFIYIKTKNPAFVPFVCFIFSFYYLVVGCGSHHFHWSAQCTMDMDMSSAWLRVIPRPR